LRGSRGIALLILSLGVRMGWVVSTTPRPLHPWERPGTHCTGGWVGPRAGLDLCELAYKLLIYKHFKFVYAGLMMTPLVG
jgi:hypothetical protein